jgi:hypothetical protein
MESRGLLSAKTGREQLQHMPRVRKAELFDHLVGGSEEGRRNGEAEHPRGRGVDDQLELGRLHDLTKISIKLAP